MDESGESGERMTERNDDCLFKLSREGVLGEKSSCFVYDLY